ncbi:MAG: PilZ domain-containing protein [Polyangiaceae bacterium]|nr:PilZ domain-containing protein [Polyangiaceae bacterium]
MQEKREHQRVSFEVETIVELVGQPREEGNASETVSGKTVSGKTVDISVGGLFVESPEPLEIGTQVVVSLSLPGVDSAKLPGFVRWVKPNGWGIQFGLLGVRETHAIGKVVRRAQLVRGTGNS